MKKIKTRKNNRLKDYNYAQPGYYYVTICTYDRKCLFGEIINNCVDLNNAGQMIDLILRTLPEHYPDILIDNYITMPNHMHAIIIIKEPVGAAPRGRPLINTGLQIDDISDENKLLDNGPAQGPAPTGLSLSDIINRFKSLTTKRYIVGVKNNNWQSFDKHLWQRSFYDQVIQTDTSLKNIRKYIINNPATWANDDENQDKIKASKRGNSLTR